MKAVLKIFLIIILSVSFLSIALILQAKLFNSQFSKKVNYTYDYSFKDYKRKVIDSMNYDDSKNDFIIYFKDGTSLKAHSYKYDIKFTK